MDFKITDRESAVLLIMTQASELLMRDIERRLLLNGSRLKREPKMLLNMVLRKCKEMHSLYDRLIMVAIESGMSCEDGTTTGDAFMNDANIMLRMILMMENALHGDSGDAELKLESMLKLMTKEPVFDQEVIDRMTNFK